MGSLPPNSLMKKTVEDENMMIFSTVGKIELGEVKEALGLYLYQLKP